MPRQNTRRTRTEARTRYFIRQQAERRGWKIAHPDIGGDFLEENEIERFFPRIGLQGDRPDFLVLLAGEPSIVIEAKNDATLVVQAIEEACDYADQINTAGKHRVRLAVGVAGEEDRGFAVLVRFLTPKGWQTLKSLGRELTAFPSRREVELALAANDATTNVTIPEQSEFIDAAIELSRVLRTARIEAPLRPKVIGTMVAAMFQGLVDINEAKALASVNQLMEQAIESAADIAPAKKARLIDALKLSGADFNRLAPSIARIVSILDRLNVRAVLQTDADFLGMFYEAFLRYGYDNNALGIVFTPRHITRYCVDLLDTSPRDRVIDIAAGTGGFLVAALDRMLRESASPAQRDSVKSSIYGFDTNPMIWALASLNMFFRGDGKSHVENASCLEVEQRATVEGRFTRAFLNPPFSQHNEPERLFIDAAMNALQPEGLLAAVVYAGIFADDDHKSWRREFLRRHTLMAMISLPEELFYPTAAPTTIVVAKAHVPHGDHPVFMSRVWNDGFEKLKNRRVPRSGEQLTEVSQAFRRHQIGASTGSTLACSTPGDSLLQGEEWSPQRWLPQPALERADLEAAEQSAVRSIFQAVAHQPELAECLLPNMSATWAQLPDLPCGVSAPLTHFFEIRNGRSSGEKNYSTGELPYISSGDTMNSIVSMIDGPDEEKFASGGISVTAFGQAAVQPWPFFARGNGGSAVRVLMPRFNMSFRELVWFAAQINLHRWRFFYARMAIKSRLSDDGFVLDSPKQRLVDSGDAFSDRVRSFRDHLEEVSSL